MASAGVQPASPARRRWQRAVAKITAQKAVVHALKPEAYWCKLRPYASILVNGFLFAPVSQAILIAAVRATCVADEAGGVRLWPSTASRADRAWLWPLVWWRSLASVFRCASTPAGFWQVVRSSSLFALHDVVTRGRTHRVERATDVGARRAAKPLLRTIAQEAACGFAGAYLTFAYMRSVLGTSVNKPSWQVLALGASAGVARGIVVATGGHSAYLNLACSWSEFLLEVMAERQGAILLGHRCHLLIYLGVVAWGILNFLPWALLGVAPCNRYLMRWFGEDPLIQQHNMIQQLELGLQQSQSGWAAVAEAPHRAADYTATVDLQLLSGPVLLRSSGRLSLSPDRSSMSMMTSSVADMRANLVSLLTTDGNAQSELELLLLDLVDSRTDRLHDILVKECSARRNGTQGLLEGAVSHILVRRHGPDMVRSALAQIAERSAEALLLGVSSVHVPVIEEHSLVSMLGLRVQFAGEDAIDGGGVRREFMDCFARAITRPETSTSPFGLREPLKMLRLGDDRTWRPMPCDEEGRGLLWALGRLLALALVYRCPCPIPFSDLVFKSILDSPFRSSDVKQIDCDFWNHRVTPLLAEGGAAARQQELQNWGMDPLTFTSADGLRELRPGGSLHMVGENNKEEYAELLCEDFLVGDIRPELGCLVMGFYDVVPKELLLERDLDTESLRMLICGVSELDVDEWEAHAVIEGDHMVAKWFFDWLRTRPAEVRSWMLAFTTGSSALPCGWEGLVDPQGRPLPFRISSIGQPEALPSARTCSNLLVLPHARFRLDLHNKLDHMIEFAGREMLLL